jgi:hypothetical protein
MQARAAIKTLDSKFAEQLFYYDEQPTILKDEQPLTRIALLL